ncbi:Axin-1 [Taenia crassiceps]|uniref:Axin-1 n=1 Tax=Taenia crassiceps TaxID=6207 RepID=A0ABR4Q9V9_9CEST
MDSHHPLSHQLDTLLNDSEGVRQFHKFLSSSFSSGHLLDFWFACKGFRSIVDGDDQLKLLQVAKAIYRTYIKTDAALSVPVNDSTKREIRSTLSAFSQSYHNSMGGDKRSPILRSLFDAAQADVQNLLARSYFLEFLQSDSFRLIHQSLSVLECNTSLLGKSSHHGCSDQADNVKRGNFSNANPQQCMTQSGSGEGISLPATDTTEQNPASCAMEQCDVGGGGSTTHTKASAGGTTSSEKSRRTTTESGGAREMVTASELIAYMNPAGGGNAIASSGADHSLSGAPPSSKPPPPTATAPVIETTTRKPGTNLAEVDPSAFAQTLSHRLEKVKESRGKMERLLSRMQPIDAEEAGGEDAELASIHAEVNKPPSPPLPARSTRLSSNSRRATSAASGDLLRKKLSALLPSSGSGVAVPSADDAQVILEDHCSRIWTDERRGQPLNVCRKGGRRSDVYSISSFDSGVGTCGGGGGGLNSSDSESCVSRGGVFHHHHHHQQQHYRWNYAPPPPPPVCSFCRRTPSMSSTPGAHRKEVVSSSSSSSNYRWGVQYQRMQQYLHAHTHHYTLEEGDCCGGGRTMRSRSLTSDSPSVFDSGLSSTYDHLPPPRRSRHDEHKLVPQTVDDATPTFGGHMSPLPDELNRLLGDCDAERNATPAALTTNLDLLNPNYRAPQPPPTRPDRQKFGQQNSGTAVTTTRCTESALLKTAPGFPSLPPPPHQQAHQSQTSAAAAFSLVVGYYLCDDPVPYRTVWTGPLTSDATATPNNPPSITLGQFKQLVAKRGVYRYFFKTASDDFGTGCVHEEVGDDNAILPLWEGKVIARVERAD